MCKQFNHFVLRMLNIYTMHFSSQTSVSDVFNLTVFQARVKFYCHLDNPENHFIPLRHHHYRDETLCNFAEWNFQNVYWTQSVASIWYTSLTLYFHFARTKIVSTRLKDWAGCLLYDNYIIQNDFIAKDFRFLFIICGVIFLDSLLLFPRRKMCKHYPAKELN